MATIGFVIAGLAVFAFVGGILGDNADNGYVAFCAVMFVIGIIIANL